MDLMDVPLAVRGTQPFQFSLGAEKISGDVPQGYLIDQVTLPF
jgi:hypothetical protein